MSTAVGDHEILGPVLYPVSSVDTILRTRGQRLLLRRVFAGASREVRESVLAVHLPPLGLSARGHLDESRYCCGSFNACDQLLLMERLVIE